MKGSKMLSMLVVLALVLSALMVTNTVADRKVVTDGSGYAEWILSNDGFGSLDRNLTCGEIITLYITNNSLTYNDRYEVGVWNITGWHELKTTAGDKVDSYGDLAISFRVPGWYELDSDPVNTNGTNDSNGQWNISLFKYAASGLGAREWDSINITIKIGNHYYLRFYDDSTEIYNLVYNKECEDFQVKIYNWTGTTLAEAKGDATKYKFDIAIHNYSATPPGGSLETLGTAKTGGVSDPKPFTVDSDIIPTSTADKEKTLWVHVEHTDKASLNSTIALPVLLDVTQTSTLTDLKWGDTFTVKGAVLDGAGTGFKSYKVRIYYPLSGTFDYEEVTTPSTGTKGTYSCLIETGSGMGYGAGTWYVGTYDAPGTRVDMSHLPPYVDGFIPYYSFEVGTKDTATVTLHNSADIVKGFTQPINVSVKNETWMDNYEFRNMNIHVTNIKGWDGTQAYDRSDIVLLTTTKKGTSDTRQYYEFEHTFNETGTATIWASWPGNLTKLDNHGSSYGNRFGNHSTSLIANITGSTTISVLSPGSMTVLVDNMPESVEKEDAVCGGWVNKSTAWTIISVYGTTESSYKNATIKVSGCGLDFTINETDDTNKYLNSKGFDDDGNGSWYNVSIIPKKAGTLTITVTNDTNTVVKDYTVTGLIGSVSTSVGDDLEITVGTTETITLTGVTEYTETKITFFSNVPTKEWECIEVLNASVDPGEFTFTPDADKIDQIGYIVVVSGVTVYGKYMYDIIEVVPVDDLTVEVTTPDAGNQTLTVGIENDVVIKLLANEDPVTEDSPGIECRLIDDDHDWDDSLQEFTFAGTGEDGEWEATIHPWFVGQLVIKGYNASDGIKHIGEITLDVDYAAITYSPSYTTAGIELDNLTITVTGVDANGNPLPDTATLYLWAENDTGDLDFDASVDLTDGAGEFDIIEVGDLKTWINATLVNNEPCDGNRTLNDFNINFPYFDVDPEEIYIHEPNVITIKAYDAGGNALPKPINLTIYGRPITAPDPAETDEEGMVIFSVQPTTSGKVNVTIARGIKYVGGVLTWDLNESVVTDTYITVTARRTMTIEVNSPVMQGDTVTVTIKSGTTPVAEVNVEFAGVTKPTGTDGVATFTAPDPGSVDSAIYKIKASKKGYYDASDDITVMKKWKITITGPTDKVSGGAQFTVTVIAKGSALAGAKVTLGDTTVTSDGNGKATFTAPNVKEDTTYTVSATYENYEAGSTTVIIKPAGIPGFELITLIAAIGVAFILLRRRRK